MFAESAFYGNIWIAQFDMPKKGMFINQHEHEHDHVSLLVSGSVSVQIGNGPETIYESPSIVLIRKNLEHKIISLSDNTLWYCVFALRDIDGNVFDQFDEYSLPKLDPMFYGNQSLASYKIKYEDALEEIEKLQIRCTKAESARDFYLDKIMKYFYNNSFLIPIKDDGTPEPPIVKQKKSSD